MSEQKWRELYVTAASWQAEVLAHYGLAEDSTPEDVFRAAVATSDSEEALSGVARDLDVTDEPSSPVLRARLAFDALVQQFGSRGAMEAIGAVRAALAATEAPAAEQHRVLGTCQDCGAQGYVGAAVAVPLDDIDALRLARALVFHRYGIRVKDANPADVDDAKAIAAAYRDAKP